MAGLLYKKAVIISCALLLLCKSAEALESNFPFPFEFGHSSDIYLDVKKENTQTRKADVEMREMLIKSGIKQDSKSVIKYIKNNDVGIIKLLLKAGYNPNADIDTNFPLYYSVKYNKTEITRLLLEYGADPNYNMYSTLRQAILNKSYNCATMLINSGADVNYVDGFTNESVLYTALKKKQYDIAAFLINKGAKIDEKSYKKIKTGKLEKTLGINLS